MLTLFPRIKANPIPPPAPREVLVVPPAHAVAEAPADAQPATPAIAPVPSEPIDQPKQSIIEILAEISLMRSAEAASPAPVAESAPRETVSDTQPAGEPIVSASAPCGAVDIGEWETVGKSEPPVAAQIDTNSETLFQAFRSAFEAAHELSPAPVGSEPVAPASALTSEQAPHAELDPTEVVLAEPTVVAGTSAVLASEVTPRPPEISAVADPAPVGETVAEAATEPTAVAAAPEVKASEPAAALETPEAFIDAQGDAPPASPVDPALRQALVSRDKPKAKGGFFVLPRVPEPEAMDDAEEVEAYASAAAQSYLDAIDDTFVAHAELLLRGRERGRALDIGTGPGQIVLKLGYHLTRWKFVGVDRSAAMIAKAKESLETAPELAGRVEFIVADGNRLNFPSHSFDLVMCNSVLHHLEEPQKLFSEMARLVRPGGALLLRDLLRPSKLGFGHHSRKHGKHYAGEMKRLYIASLRAAYTEEELRQMVAASTLTGVEVFVHRKTHIGFARAIAPAPPRKP